MDYDEFAFRIELTHRIHKTQNSQILMFTAPIIVDNKG